MKKTNITKTSLIAVILLLTAMSVSAEDAPSMWMVQDGNNIDLMVNTSEVSSGANAWIYFDPACVNITDIDFTCSPWVPLDGNGWSHQIDNITLALTNFKGVNPGEYKIATMQTECVGGNCTSAIEITKAEPIGVVVYNTTFVCSDLPQTDTTIKIGNGIGTTTLPIIISDADNVGAVDITMKYDPNIARITGVSDGDMDCTYTNLEHVSEGWIRIGAIQGNNPGLSGQFTLLNIDFEPIGSNACCDLELSVTTFKDATPDCNPMSYSAINGTYISSMNGDANGDEVIDIADAAYIARHVIGIVGYESINADTADVNGDSVIDMSDSMYLTKHVIGMSGYENLR